jgi:hypothetical protein
VAEAGGARHDGRAVAEGVGDAEVALPPLDELGDVALGHADAHELAGLVEELLGDGDRARRRRRSSGVLRARSGSSTGADETARAPKPSSPTALLELAQQADRQAVDQVVVLVLVQRHHAGASARPTRRADAA